MVKKVREEVFKSHPGFSRAKKIILMLPILLSVSWILYLQFSPEVYVYSGRELLSPVDTTPLMIALVIFTIGYIVFLLMMFSENLHDIIWKWLGH